MNKELITKEIAAEIVQKFYNNTSDILSKCLLHEVRYALLSAPAAVPNYKLDSKYAFACLKQAEQRVYDSAGVPAEMTSKHGNWVKIDNHRWKCSICGEETDLPHYDEAIFCFNCGSKMLEEITNETSSTT